MASVVTTGQVKTFVRGLNNADDEEITPLLNAADRALAKWLKRPGVSPTLEQTTYTDFLDGPVVDRPRQLLLRVAPVVSLTDINDDPDRNYGSSTDIPIADVDIEPDGRTIDLRPESSHGSFGYGRRRIRVIYEAGFSSSTPPDDVVMAVLLTVRENWRLKSVSGLPNAAVPEEGPSFVIPAAAKALISQWKAWETGTSG